MVLENGKLSSDVLRGLQDVYWSDDEVSRISLFALPRLDLGASSRGERSAEQEVPPFSLPLLSRAVDRVQLCFLFR